MVGQVEPLVGTKIDHAVVAGDHQRCVGRQLFRERPNRLIDRDQLIAPCLRGNALDVTGRVQA